jgi:cytochrome P450
MWRIGRKILNTSVTNFWLFKRFMHCACVQEVICAGTDTSAVTMEWGLVQLLKNPSAMKKAQDELDNVIGKDRVVTEDDLQSLPYLQAIVKETFRLHPPAPLLVPHFSNEDTEIGGYKIAANTRVFINAWAVQRHPSAYEDPLEFKPERFVGSGVDVRGTDYQLVPFGTGRRSCPAMPLGTIMVQLGLSRLLQAFDWSLPDGEDPKDIDMDEIFGITVPKRIPLHAIATPRLPAHLYAL